MKSILIIIFLIIATNCLTYSITKRNRKHPLQNKSQAEVMLYYLHKQNLRHAKDIVRGKADIKKICDKWKLAVPKADADDWIET